MRAEIWHGTNNKFIVLFCGSRFFNIQKDFIKDISIRYNLDGVVQIKVLKDIYIKFFNPDGTRDNCGNALRVSAFFCYENRLVSNKGVIFSCGLKFPFEINGKKSKVIFQDIRKDKNKWIIGKVPHKVVIVKNFEESKGLAKKWRKESNCNITLVKIVNNILFAQTFEVGVEGFTASCGTGAIAASLSTGNKKIFMPGGLLEIDKSRHGVGLKGLVRKVGEVSNEI